MAPLLIAALCVFAIAAIGGISFVTLSQNAPPPLTVTGVTPNQSSARVFYQPVAGAKDYRVYDAANPTDVKYAGVAHYVPWENCPGSFCLHHFVTDSSGAVVYPLQVQADNSVQRGPNTVQDVPATDVEWNGLGDGQQHTLILQAVDALGPAPQHNLYPFACCGAHSAIFGPADMLGSNKGQTMDGNLSTNGQGPYTNNPKVIAQSQPFVVQGLSNLSPLGKIAGASQTFLDTFDQSEAAAFRLVNSAPCTADAFSNHGSATYSLNAGTPKAWSIFVKNADFDDTMPFIASSHFMDMLFDGGTPKCNSPTDTDYSSLSMMPTQAANMTGGGIVHMTMEVDAHQSFRRWLAFNLSPANATIQGFNTSFGGGHDNALFFETRTNAATLSLYNNSGTPSQSTCDSPAFYFPSTNMENGRGLDDRSRLDFFVSQTHWAFFQDNKLVCQGNLNISWFNQPLSVYFSHYLYHSDADIADMRGFVLNGGTFAYPLNSYWFNDPQNGTSASSTSSNTAYPAGYGFPHSDERHWDNMGYEVLPAAATGATDFSSLLASVMLPNPSAPQFVNGPPPTPLATQTSTPVPAATSTTTPLPAATSTPLPADTATPVSTATAQPASTSTAVPTSTPTVTTTCAVVVLLNGQQTSVSRPSDFCTNQ